MSTFTDFFGLKEDPFKRTPDIDYYFRSSRHTEVIQTLTYLVESEEGFAVITGEPGTGKTVSVRKFIHELPDTVEFAYILFPNLNPEDLFKAILEDFGVECSDAVSKNMLFSRLKEHLLNCQKAGKQVLIIIDEAQNLPMDSLEELRILSNLETEKEKLLKILLVGQPELDEKLASPQLRQLRQRITLHSSLCNLSKEETIAYIEYRLDQAGRRRIPLQKGVAQAIYKHSGGNPRLVNILMERTLIAAFLAGSHAVKLKHVKSAVASVSSYNEILGRRTRYVWLIAVAFVVLLTGVAAGWYLMAAFGGGASAPVQHEPKVALHENATAAPAQENATAGYSTGAVPPVDIAPQKPAEQPQQTEKPKQIEKPKQEKKPEVPKVAYPRSAVVLSALKVRSAPSLTAEQVSGFPRGASVTVFSETAEWAEVETLEGERGWVFKKFIRFRK